MPKVRCGVVRCCVLKGTKTSHAAWRVWARARALQPGGEAVEVDITGGQAGNFAAALKQLLNAREGPLQQRVDRLRPAGLRPLLGSIFELFGASHQK